MSDQTPDINDIFQIAQADGNLSQASFDALTIDADTAAQIQNGLGVAPEDVPASEVVLVSMMPDDSGSIRFAGNAEAVRQGHNEVLDALKASKQEDEILVHNRYLNGHILYPYGSLDTAIRMDKGNYDPNLGTPLYDQTAVLLGSVLAKTGEFEQCGVPCRSITLLITDGDDVSSVRQNPKTIRNLVEDLLRAECHTIAAMGIDDGRTDFHQVFRQMGIPREWILTPANTETEIRNAFRVFSQSAVQVSQNAVLPNNGPTFWN